MLIGATTTNLFAPSHLASRSENALSRTGDLPKDAEMRKKRVPGILASVLGRNASLIPFALSANGALGPVANPLPEMVLSHAKIASEFNMRHSHAVTAPTWSNKWFSIYWRQRVVVATTATNSVFTGRILNADAAAACSGFKANRPSRLPRYCFFGPRRARGSMVPSSAAG